MGIIFLSEVNVKRCGKVEACCKPHWCELVPPAGFMFEKTKLLTNRKPVIIIGSGWDAYIEDYKNQDTDESALKHLSGKYPDAEHVAELAMIAFEKGEYQSVEDAQPVYLRNNVAEKSKK